MSQHTDIINNYHNLSEFYKGIIRLYGLAIEPMDTTNAFKCLERLFIRPRGGKLLHKNMRDFLTTLSQKGFLKKINNSKFRIQSEIEAVAVRDLYKNRENFDRYAEALKNFTPIFAYAYTSWTNVSILRFYRDARIALLQGNMDSVNDIMQRATFRYGKNVDFDEVTRIVLHPLDTVWLKQLPSTVIEIAAYDKYNDMFDKFEIDNDFFDFLEKNEFHLDEKEGRTFRDFLTWKYLLQGNIAKAKQIQQLETLSPARKLSYAGMMNFLIGNNDLAVKSVDAVNKAYRKAIKKRSGYSIFQSTQFLYLALLKDDLNKHLDTIKKYLSSLKLHRPLSASLLAVILAQANQMSEVREIFGEHDEEGLGFVFINYAKYWVHGKDAYIDVNELEQYYLTAEKHQLKYPQLLIADLLQAVFKDQNKAGLVKRYQKISNDLQEETTFVSIINLVPRVENWERSLMALTALSDQFEQTDNVYDKDKRLLWLFNAREETLEVKEQKIGKNGKWTKGRSIGYDRLSTIARTEDYLLEQDLLLIQSIDYNWYNTKTYELNDNMIRAMIGHPHLYLDNKQRSVLEVVEQAPQLIVQQIGDQYQLSFSVPVDEVGMFLVKETPTRYKAIEVTEQHHMIAAAIGGEKVLLPVQSAEKLSKIIKGFSKVIDVQSELAADNIDVRKVDANPTTHIHLLPVGDGFQLEMYVKPFGEYPPYYKPSEGGTIILTEIEGERVQTERDLDKEKEQARAIIKACPSLGNARKLSKIWEFEDAEACLEILSELEPLKKEEKVIVEWPKGERIKLRGTASFDNLAMSIKGSTDWFEANGSLKVGEDLVLGMKEVLGMLEGNNSRFIKLENGQFLALTNRFRTQLQALRAYGDTTKDGGIRFHPLAAFAVEELANDTKDLKTDSAWKKQLKKLRDAEKKKPRLPSTFKAELRSYQQEGYKWLMKLSNWEVGACLADDMGLGKTVQALAAILTRAKSGPTLIICPASVRINWQREAMKFAPTLNPIQFGQGDRQKILDELKPYDMLISSYGLLQSEEEAFSKIQFSTIVLDEAQAIKNRLAKRSKAAMALNGDFKIITTGTPIENHLGELWNLFRFINPGLLGSLDRFRERFALPIEKYGDDARREQLKKLIQPFILRRRKSEVLLELPEKTEIALAVDLSPAEKAFYEALRQTAMEKLKDVQPGDGGQHLRVLAEITRLRQACCNPQLVMPNSKIRSSKLELFEKTVDELLENGHKVLVFSQFVKHLKILESSLKTKKISYQYLDGSTTQKKRQKAIDAFQGGEGDVFLISLKAGGVGLNLTAADYVIHMDPWWNPAVEDQASDRAHRMGQKRPVTIYRFVTQGTIEEKIVKLHDQKRDLADSLLSGTNKGGKLTADDLMDLIKEGMKE